MKGFQCSGRVASYQKTEPVKLRQGPRKTARFIFFQVNKVEAAIAARKSPDSARFARDAGFERSVEMSGLEASRDFFGVGPAVESGNSKIAFAFPPKPLPGVITTFNSDNIQSNICQLVRPAGVRTQT